MSDPMEESPSELGEPSAVGRACLSTDEIDSILKEIRSRSKSSSRPPMPSCRAPPLPLDSNDETPRDGEFEPRDSQSLPLLTSSLNVSQSTLDSLSAEYEQKNSEAQFIIQDIQAKILNVNKELDRVTVDEGSDSDPSLKIRRLESGCHECPASGLNGICGSAVGPRINSQAEEKKEEGNELYKTKNYIDALSKYSEAIALCPDNPAFYGNRSACFMMLGQYSNALEDAKRSVSINPEFIKGYVRVAKCCIMLGDVMSAKQAIQQIETLDPGNSALKSEGASLEHLENFKASADAAFRSGDYRKAVYLLNQCHSIASGANDIKVYLAECLAHLGRLDESKEIVYDVLRANSMDADAIYVKGLCLYYEDVIPKAFSHFQRVLMLAPDHHKAKEVFKKAKLLKQKKDEGNAAFKDNKLTEALKLYSEALLIDPINSLTNAKLFFNRATVLAKVGKLEESIEDCNSALELDSSYLKALMRRAKSYMSLEDYESAVKDYETLAKKDPHNSEYQQMLRNAKIDLKRSQRKDYYKILGVTKDANDDEIKKAYRKRALVHHPDRHSSASEKERVEHEKIFKEVGEAYGILSDRKKRSKYDNGGDYEAVDPTQVFQTFFGTNMQGGGFSGMPGGFHFQFG